MKKNKKNSKIKTKKVPNLSKAIELCKKKCIFCLREDYNPSIEHIIPQSLGCPPGLILNNGEVCEKCNNILGKRLDKILDTIYEPYKFFHGIVGVICQMKVDHLF